MTRLTRAESQRLTRQRLLEAATTLFAQEGYAGPSVERIAEAAGYSKGAVYANFESKEAIFLAVLEGLGAAELDGLLADIASAADARAIVRLLADWADGRSRSGRWQVAVLEHARAADPQDAGLERQRAILRAAWQRLGAAVAPRLAMPPALAETLGALLYEIAYAPALTFIDKPTPGDLMRLALTPWAHRAGER